MSQCRDGEGRCSELEGRAGPPLLQLEGPLEGGQGPAWATSVGTLHGHAGRSLRVATQGDHSVRSLLVLTLRSLLLVTL